MERHMAHLMAQDAAEFFVRHGVHDAAVHADAAVGTGEGVHLRSFVHFEIEGHLIDAVHAVDDFAQALGIGAGLRQNLALGIQLGNVLMHIGGYLVVRKRKGLNGVDTALNQTAGIKLGYDTAGRKDRHCGHKTEETFHNTGLVSPNIHIFSEYSQFFSYLCTYE